MNQLLTILFATITSFGLTFFAIPSIINVCINKKLYDTPCSRKNHKNPTPSMGGLAIFAGYVFAVTFWSEQDQIKELQYIIASTLIIFFMGLKDDLMDISPFKKILGQVFSSLIVIFFAKIQLTSLYGVFGIYHISYFVGVVSSLFIILAITNSFNLIDGIDGLAATIASGALAFYGYWFFSIELYQYSILSFSLVGSLLAFLYYNRSPAKIFMGDTGSLLVGLIIALLSVKFIEVNQIVSSSSNYKIFSGPVIAITILIIPLFDTTQVFVRRIWQGKSPFKADRLHLHHLLQEFNLTSRTVCLSLFSTTLSLILISFFLKALSPELNLVIIFTICTLALALLIKIKKTRQKIA